MRFDIAFTFTREHRDFIRSVADSISSFSEFSAERVLFDEYHEEELSTPRAGLSLLEWYKKESILVVVALSVDYDQVGSWTFFEWPQVLSLIRAREQSRAVMLLRMDSALPNAVAGLSDMAFALDARTRAPHEVADAIRTRFRRISPKNEKSLDSHTEEEVTQRSSGSVDSSSSESLDRKRCTPSELNSVSFRHTVPFGAASPAGASTASPSGSTRPHRQRLVFAILLMVALLTTSLVIHQWLANRNAQTVRSNQLAVELLTEDSHDVARRQLQAALEADPNSAETWSNLGALEERAGRPTESEDAYRRAAELASESSFHLRNYASILIDHERYEEAIELLEMSLEIDPDHAEALNDLGWIYLQLERPRLAWQQLQRGLLIEHADTTTRATLHKNAGWASLQLEHPASAITSLETALSDYELPPKLLLEAQLLLAYALAQSERRPEACLELQDFAANSGLGFRWWRDPKELAQQLDCLLE